MPQPELNQSSSESKESKRGSGIHSLRFFQDFSNEIENVELGSEIGSGRQAIVYKAKATTKTGGDLDVAIKMRNNNDYIGISSEEEFKISQKAQQSCHVLPMFCFKKENLKPYFVMPYAPSTLEEFLLHTNGTYTDFTAKMLIHDLFSVVRDLHELGIVHRDLTKNFVIYEGRLKLIDFGEASLEIDDSKKRIDICAMILVAQKILSKGLAAEHSLSKSANTYYNWLKKNRLPLAYSNQWFKKITSQPWMKEMAIADKENTSCCFSFR